jgi:hypothetical protein
LKVPQSLLDRRDGLAAEVEHFERERAFHQFALDELDSAISIIGDEFEEFADPTMPQSDPASQPNGPGPQWATQPVQLTAPVAPGQRAPKRDIKTLVLDELTRATAPHTAKEIAKAIQGGQASVDAALEHWKAQGQVALNPDGTWWKAKAEQPVGPLVPRHPDPAPAAPQPAPTGSVAVTTQEKLVQALKAAGATGMTDDELAAVGIPFVAVIQYERLGWTRKEGDRYVLNQPPQ